MNHDRIIYYKKAPQSLILDDYMEAERVKKARCYKSQYDAFQQGKRRYVEISRYIETAYPYPKPIPGWLWDEYQTARADFMLAYGALNQEFSKYANE